MPASFRHARIDHPAAQGAAPPHRSLSSPAQTMLLSSWSRGIQRLQLEMESSPTSMRTCDSGPDCHSAPQPRVFSGVPLGTAGSGMPAGEGPGQQASMLQEGSN